MFIWDNHGRPALSPADCEDIARCAETFGVTVGFAPEGLKLSKTRFSLRGAVGQTTIIPWTVLSHARIPAMSIKADIQSLAAGIDRTVNARRSA